MSTIPSAPDLRERAATRIKKRHDFYTHLTSYLLVNGFLVVLWAMTVGPGFFWPIFPIFGWGVGIAMHAWDVFLSPDITEADIDREVARMTGRD
jgi:2TM domain